MVGKRKLKSLHFWERLFAFHGILEIYERRNWKLNSLSNQQIVCTRVPRDDVRWLLTWRIFSVYMVVMHLKDNLNYSGRGPNGHKSPTCDTQPLQCSDRLSDLKLNAPALVSISVNCFYWIVIRPLKVPITPKYFFGWNKFLHLFETHCAFLN